MSAQQPPDRRATLVGSHLHFDAHAGIAGDMTVAALVDLGVPPEVVLDAIGGINLRGLHTRFERRQRGGFAALGFLVSSQQTWTRVKQPVHALAAPAAHQHGHPDHHHGHADHHHAHAEHAHEHRAYADIKRLLRDARLDGAAREIAEDIFHRLAVVEGKRHGVAVDEVSFHEVGAWDSIADVVGVAAAIAYLSPVSISSSAVVVGTGRVKTAHGLLSVPAPATAALLEGVPIISEGQGELATPTGAAILASLAKTFGAPPAMTLLGSGYGAGTKELSDRPNVLRVMCGHLLGDALPAPAQDVLSFAANIDDLSGQLVAPLVEALFDAGAVDAWTTPIVMKKGRAALEVSALAPFAVKEAIERAYFTNSTTLGVRVSTVTRTVLPRAHVSVETSFGRVRIKVGTYGGRPTTASPEYEDCYTLARAAGVPVRTVYAEALVHAHRLSSDGDALEGEAHVPPRADVNATHDATKAKGGPP